MVVFKLGRGVHNGDYNNMSNIIVYVIILFFLFLFVGSPVKPIY